MRPPHLVAHSVMVRMLFDESFAAAVARAPHEVLPMLPAALAEQLGAVDPRALRRDRHRVERTLGYLCAELPAATLLAVAEQGRMTILLDFFRSTQLHEALHEGMSLVLALAAYLELKLAEGALRSPHVAAVLAIEVASAHARRSGEDAPQPKPSLMRDDTPLRRARGVEVVTVPAGTLAALQIVEQHRFRMGLVPAWTVATDPPALPALPKLGPARCSLAVVSIAKHVSLVEIDAALFAVLSSLPSGTTRTKEAVRNEAEARLGDVAAIDAAIASLIEDELVLASAEAATSSG